MKCYHNSMYGVMDIGNERVGLCLDCSVIVDINNNKPVSKEDGKVWMKYHPQETETYKLYDK